MASGSGAFISDWNPCLPFSWNGFLMIFSCLRDSPIVRSGFLSKNRHPPVPTLDRSPATWGGTGTAPDVPSKSAWPWMVCLVQPST